MARGLSTVTRNPTRAVGQADHGEIAVCLLAELVRITRVAGVTVTREVFSHGGQVA